MPTRVLAFESDAQFARELDTQFRSLGCEITVVDDVNLGLQAASANKPDLILLTIELPRMSGYSVCNRIKRDADLKDIPLIILSSESSDQTFEQHKRLATRAQDYVKKPVGFSQLLERARKFVALSGSVSISPDDDGIVIDDEIEIADEDVIGAQPRSSAPSHRPIDADIDDFAEHAFGAMLDSPQSSSSHRPPLGATGRLASAIPVAPRVPDGMTGVGQSHSGSVELERAQDEANRVRIQLEEKDRLLAEARGEIRELKRFSRASAAETTETENLRRELQELKTKLAPAGKPSVGPSAREFLDLREQLNKKDKELLELRDQITHKDKELLNLRDSSLSRERESADLSDKVDDLTRQLGELQKIADAVRNDKEAAAKRAEDHKRKADKLSSQLDDKIAELEKAVARHSAEVAERDAERSRIANEHAASLEAARAETARTISQAEQHHRNAIEIATAEALRVAEAHEQQTLELERQAAADQRSVALSELEHRLREELGQDKMAALNKVLSEKKDSEHQRDDRIAILQAEAERYHLELEQANGRVAERDQNIASLESMLRGVRGELEQANRTLEIRDERLKDPGVRTCSATQRDADNLGKLVSRAAKVGPSA